MERRRDGLVLRADVEQNRFAALLQQMPRGERAEFSLVGSLEHILLGPSTVPDGTMNLVGALRKAMATTGYTEIKEFQRVEIVVG